ncbi:MAG: alkaline phosphatase family protein [Gemmatimonadota bacterium]
MPINMRLPGAFVTPRRCAAFLAAGALLLVPATKTIAQPASGPSSARPSVLRTRNVVLIVTDGLRWQELFGGADATLLTRQAGGVADTADLRRRFWRESAAERRAALFPFVWRTIATEGQLYGNPEAGRDARTQNPLKFSYPGYNELLTGAYDPRITSNDHPPNPNVTVFEWIARQPGFRGRVAAVATWSAYRRIFNRERAGIPVHDGWDAPFATAPQRTGRQAMLDELYRTSTRLWPDNATDALMHATAKELIRRDRPRLLFLGYGETDEWAHAGRYDLLLQSAHAVDGYLADLWALMQRDPGYRGRTTFVVTTDHGRGDGPARWKDHGEDVDGADRIWMAILGPDTPPRGDRVRSVRVTQAQVAATVAALLGLDWPAASPGAAPPVREALSP